MENDSFIDDPNHRDDSVSMSSVSLQKRFYSTYKYFFNTHNLIFSGHSILTWWADISHGISVLRLKQKLPMKTFIWVNYTTSSRVTFRTIFVYSIGEGSFEEVPFGKFFPERMEHISAFLEDFLKLHGYSSGIEISFLTETPPGQGFAFSSVMSVLLTILVHTIALKLDPDTLIWGELHNAHPLFEELYHFSLELSNIISHGKSIGGGGNYAVMVSDTALPVVYIYQKDHPDYRSGIQEENNLPTHAPSPVEATLYKDTLLHFLWIDRASSDWALPLDYGIISTGRDYRFGDTESMRDRVNERAQWDASFIQDTITKLHIWEDEKKSLSKLFHIKKIEVLHSVIDAMNLRILEGFHILLDSSNRDNNDTYFIDTIRKTWLMSFAFQKINKFFLAFKYHFYRLAQFEDEDIGIIPFNTGKIWGSLLFVMKAGKSRKTLQKTMDTLKGEGHSITFPYLSWRDGYASRWVCLEQYIGRKIYSKYTQSGDVSYTDSLGKSYVADYESILSTEKESLLLDAIGGRIYIRGVKLTSKDIHSQNTTIDVLRILIKNIGQEVSNSRLPISTYSQNKNEITTKIITPLKSLIEKHFGEDIALSCTWGITEYYLRLTSNIALPIGLIETLES